MVIVAGVMVWLGVQNNWWHPVYHPGQTNDVSSIVKPASNGPSPTEISKAPKTNDHTITNAAAEPIPKPRIESSNTVSTLTNVPVVVPKTLTGRLTITNPQTYPPAVELLNKLLNALAMPDDSQRLQAVLPLVHKSLLRSDGLDFLPQYRANYSSAVRGVSSYVVPVKITSVERRANSASGTLRIGEEGESIRYYIARLPKPGGTGTVHIFFPADGTPPRIIEFGLL